MRVFAALFVASTIAAAAIFTACGDETFSAAADDASPGDALDDDAAIVTDARPTGDGPTPDPCKDPIPHTLCDNFDGLKLSAIWISDPPCIDPTLDKSVSLSPPQSLHATSPSNPGCALFTGNVGTIPSRHLACAVDFNFGSTLPTDYGEIFKVTLSLPNASYYQVAIGLSGQQAFLEEDAVLFDSGDPNGKTPIPIDPAGLTERWVHSTIDVDIATGVARASLGSQSAVRKLESVPDSGAPAVMFQIRAGFAYLPNDGGIVSINYDNVACDLL